MARVEWWWCRDNMDSHGAYNNGSDRGGGVVAGVEHGAVGMGGGATSNTGVRRHHTDLHFAGLRLLQISPPCTRHHS